MCAGLCLNQLRPVVFRSEIKYETSLLRQRPCPGSCSANLRPTRTVLLMSSSATGLKMALSAYTVQTLYVLYIFTGLAIFLMVFRVVLRRVRGQQWNLSDYLTMVCMFFLLARTSMIHVVLVWGTNNVPRIYRHHHNFTDKEIYQRETASKLLLVSRTMYNT